MKRFTLLALVATLGCAATETASARPRRGHEDLDGYDEDRGLVRGKGTRDCQELPPVRG